MPTRARQHQHGLADDYLLGAEEGVPFSRVPSMHAGCAPCAAPASSGRSSCGPPSCTMAGYTPMWFRNESESARSSGWSDRTRATNLDYDKVLRREEAEVVLHLLVRCDGIQRPHNGVLVNRTRRR